MISHEISCYYIILGDILLCGINTTKMPLECLEEMLRNTGIEAEVCKLL